MYNYTIQGIYLELIPLVFILLIFISIICYGIDRHRKGKKYYKIGLYLFIISLLFAIITYTNRYRFSLSQIIYLIDLVLFIYFVMKIRSPKIAQKVINIIFIITLFHFVFMYFKAPELIIPMVLGLLIRGAYALSYYLGTHLSENMYYESNIVIKKIKDVNIRFGLVYPNVYKVAMTSLGYQILYHLLNEREDTYCERIVYPYTRSIETNSPLSDFNIISFTLQFEQDYFNLIEILKKAEIPIKREERKNSDPLIIAGGPCVTANPMPLFDFIDIFIIGEGEEVLKELIEKYNELDNPKDNLKSFLDIEGLYIPKYDNKTEIALIEDMDKNYHITKPIVIESEDISYRPAFGNAILLNVSRGCSRGCRFCMSGYLYRPQRETSLEKLIEVAKISRENTNINRIALISYAVSDYSQIDELTSSLLDLGFEISTPSMRIETITNETLKFLKESGLRTLTIAPESIYKLRKSINKDISDDLIDNVVEKALKKGFNLKLYFIIGFPNETEEDILNLTKYIKSIEDKKNTINKKLSVKFSINALIPKAQTPLQWETYDYNAIKLKMRYLKKELKGINVKFDSAKYGLMQYVLSCAGRELGDLLEKYYDEKISTSIWKKYLPDYKLEDELPWSNIDIGLREDFLIEEYEKMQKNENTPWCESDRCYNCKYNCL